jgi:hypothetical protein
MISLGKRLTGGDPLSVTTFSTEGSYTFGSPEGYQIARNSAKTIGSAIVGAAAVETVGLGVSIATPYAAPYLRSLSNSAVLSESAIAAKGGSRVFEVGSYNTLKGVEAGLEAHHVGQRALMKKFVPGYNANTAPSILVPKQGHMLGSGVLSRGTSGFSNARQVLARDIFELRRVYPNVPNSSLQQLIQMNKTMYPGAFIK